MNRRNWIATANQCRWKTTEPNTIVRLAFSYSDHTYYDKRYEFDFDFGLPVSKELARYMIEDGNYGCDCNRSMIIQDNIDPTFPALECGDTIKLVGLEFKEGLLS